MDHGQRAGMSVGFHTTLEIPGIFFCSDFPGLCCSDCHEKGHVIAMYPWSIYSEGHKEKMPDLGMGLRAEVCCGKFHLVRELPREWWVRRYGEKQRYSAPDIERLVAARIPAAFLKVRGELASKYYDAPGSREVRPIFEKGTGPKRVAGPQRAAPIPRSKSRGRGCPSCGSNWDGIACDNCGHS